MGDKSDETLKLQKCFYSKYYPEQSVAAPVETQVGNRCLWKRGPVTAASPSLQPCCGDPRPPPRQAVSVGGVTCFPPTSIEAPRPREPSHSTMACPVELCYPPSGHVRVPTVPVSFNSAAYSSVISSRVFSSLCFLFSASLWDLIS